MTMAIFPTLPGLTYTTLKTPVFDTIVNRAPNAYEVRIAQTKNPVWDFTLIYDFLHDFQWGQTTQFNLITELRTMMGFFNQMQGKAIAFLYNDTDDNAVGPAIQTTAPITSSYYMVGQSALDPANHWQQCTVAGVSGSSLPTWNDTGGTTGWGGATFQDMGSGYSAGFPNFLAQLPIVDDGVGHYYSPIQRTLNGIAFEDITDLNGSIAVYNDAVLATVGNSLGEYHVAGPGLALPTASYMGLYVKWVEPAAWAVSTGYSIGELILDPIGHVQRCITAGSTTGASGPPIWNDSGGTTADHGTLVWQDDGYNPGPGGPITAAFNFYFRVRFDSDSQDFEKFLGIGNAASKILANAGGGYWTIGGSNSAQGSGTLRLTTARPVPL